MGRLVFASLICALSTPAAATGPHDWRLVRKYDQAYAYDANAIETDPKTSARTVWIFVGTNDGYTKAGYAIDCRTDHGEFVGAISGEEMTMAEGNGLPSDPGWAAVPATGSMRIAADVACAREIYGAIRVDSEQAAVDGLKNLSN